MRIRLPEGSNPGSNGKVPLVLFSPGLGGGIVGGTHWAKAWAARGIAVIHLEHPGSDFAIYRDAGTPAERRARVRAAASAEQLQARIGDVGFILDELGRRRREAACDLTRIDLTRIGAAGHSMGAWTVQGLAGQRFGGDAPFRDPRIKAAIAFSPSALTRDSPDESFGAISIPFFSVTGSRDGSVIRPTPTTPGISTEAQRTAPFMGMKTGGKYLLVFKDGDHMVFSGNLRRTATATDTHIQTVTAAATTAFWGMTLLGDRRDRDQLATGLPLAHGDRFEQK